MKRLTFRTFAAGLALIGLLGISADFSTATAVAVTKTTKSKKKTNPSSSGADRRAEPAASAPLGKSKHVAKSSTAKKKKKKPKRRTKSKGGVNKGVFTADITTSGRTRTIKSPAATVSALRRAAAARRRAEKTGKADDTFKVVINLNDVQIEFTDPAVAEEACRELVKVLFRARKDRIFLGDIGQIEAADMVVEELPATSGTGSASPPKTKKKRRRISRKQKQQAAAQSNARLLAARRALRFRINMKIQMEVRKNRGRRLSQSRIKQIVQAEIEQARKDGLIPASGQNAGAGSADSGDRGSRVQNYRRELGRAFAKGKRLGAEN